MRTSQIILDILFKQSIKNNELTNLYPLLYKRVLYNTKEDKIVNNIIEELKVQRYQFGKNSFSDKLLEEVIYQILYTIYEPKFSNSSHWMRDNRGIYSALFDIKSKGQASEFFIKFRIDNLLSNIDIDHLLSILSNTIKDNRFIYLINRYIKKYKFSDSKNINRENTLSDSLVGNKLLCLLLNIFLNELDQFIDYILRPLYNKEDKRPLDKEYSYYLHRRQYLEKKVNKDKSTIDEIKTLRKLTRNMNSKCKLSECNYRRFNYVRYGDECLITFTGLFTEAKNIISYIESFITNVYKSSNLLIKYQYNKDKPIIPCLSNNTRFLGFDIEVQWSKDYIGSKNERITRGQIGFLLPKDIVNKYKSIYYKRNKPRVKPYCIGKDLGFIFGIFQKELLLLVNYYSIVKNTQLLSTLRWYIQSSFLETCSTVLSKSISKVSKLLKTKVKINDKYYVAFAIVKCTNNLYYPINSISYSKSSVKETIYFDNIDYKRKQVSKFNTKVIDKDIISIRNRYCLNSN